MTLEKSMQIISLSDELSPSRRAWLVGAAERIFFASSATATFASEDERTSFCERWFARYARDHPANFLLALYGDDMVAGYLAGALADPGQDPAFADLDYDATFAALARQYPTHLHINIADNRRNQGIGAALIRAFMAQVAAAGRPGAHLVTNAASRNVAFYQRNGFAELARAERPGKVLVLLGRQAFRPA